ncbi:hypothetical protein BSKO_13612 [Bryopsis sp. KO-2023]|nr:hypothetical protein BSKO_13612 [Bryopsis sp. KO-2023]
MPHSSVVGGPLPTHARQGRLQQRYGDGGERLIAGCIPVRFDGEGPDGVRVLLVTRRCGEGFVFPKGGWELDEATAEEAAKRETVEEAGVRGCIEEPLIGVFPFVSQKRSDLADSKGKCLAHMYVLRVEEELVEWPEQDLRKRSWHSLEEACEICVHEWMRKALHIWMERKGWLEAEKSTSNGNSNLHPAPTENGTSNHV